VLDTDWGIAGAQPQSGQHHVRFLKEVSWIYRQSMFLMS